MFCRLSWMWLFPPVTLRYSSIYILRVIFWCGFVSFDMCCLTWAKWRFWEFVWGGVGRATKINKSFSHVSFSLKVQAPAKLIFGSGVVGMSVRTRMAPRSVRAMVFWGIHFSSAIVFQHSMGHKNIHFLDFPNGFQFPVNRCLDFHGCFWDPFFFGYCFPTHSGSLEHALLRISQRISIPCKSVPRFPWSFLGFTFFSAIVSQHILGH